LIDELQRLIYSKSIEEEAIQPTDPNARKSHRRKGNKNKRHE